MVALHRALTADGWQPRDEFSGLPEALERADEDARAAGAEQSAIPDLRGAGYRSADGRFALDLSFRYFEQYTGQPAPVLGADEYAVMVSLNHESFRE